MAAKHWMAGAFASAHGQLHAALGVPKDEKIPRSKLKAAVRKGGVNARRAQLVMNANPIGR
ncbi:MAG: hypothetical protein ACRETH_06210 [Steroidobacteraceae bacterium]